MFLQRNIPYEARLHKMKISEENECIKCKTKETLIHLYWECPHSARLWERLKAIVENHLHSPFQLDKEKCLLGSGNWLSKRKRTCIWTLSILTKHYIHLCKCNENERNLQGLENYIKSQLRMEKMVATRKGKFNLFAGEWNGMLDWIDS